MDDHKTEVGYMVTCAGSLSDYNIRFANQPGGSKGSGYFDIVSLTGVPGTGGSHIHISISDCTGKTIGGRLLYGCKVFTTAKFDIGEDKGKIFTRQSRSCFWA